MMPILIEVQSVLEILLPIILLYSFLFVIPGAYFMIWLGWVPGMRLKFEYPYLRIIHETKNENS